MKSKFYSGNQNFSLFTLCCYFKGVTSEIRNKSAVVVTENSDHNRITSMSCLKKVFDTEEMECGKSFTSVALWSDGMGTQFRSRFIFQVLAGKMFLNKSLVPQWGTPWQSPNGWRNQNHHKRHFPKSKGRPDWGPYTQRIFWCCHEICAIYCYCVLA